jgi:23S rRNA (adenine2503-C2)-methyltransferase
MNDTLPNIRNLDFNELQNVVTQIGEKPVRAQQLYQWLWQKHAISFDEMSNLSKPFRETLANRFSLLSLTPDIVQTSADGTIKMRFITFDNYFIESVLIPTENRKTACISSQVGCSLSCKFCATGQMERKRNLFFDEIFDQAAFLNDYCQQHFQQKLTNIVFMGMGEPLLNYQQVLKAVSYLTHIDGLAMSARRITVSTAGVAKMIKKLGEDKVRFKLALSLHAANDENRNKIMPINENNHLQ